MHSVAQLYLTLWSRGSSSSLHGISMQKYWGRLPFHTPGNFPTQGLNPISVTPMSADGFFYQHHMGSSWYVVIRVSIDAYGGAWLRPGKKGSFLSLCDIQIAPPITWWITVPSILNSNGRVNNQLRRGHFFSLIFSFPVTNASLSKLSQFCSCK